MTLTLINYSHDLDLIKYEWPGRKISGNNTTEDLRSQILSFPPSVLWLIWSWLHLFLSTWDRYSRTCFMVTNIYWFFYILITYHHIKISRKSFAGLWFKPGLQVLKSIPWFDIKTISIQMRKWVLRQFKNRKVTKWYWMYHFYYYFEPIWPIEIGDSGAGDFKLVTICWC